MITPVGNHSGLIQTGFDVNAIAFDFGWTVHVIDDFGVSDKNWGRPIWTSHWVGTNNFRASGQTWAFVEVTYGVAFLINGSICYSYGPWDQRFLF
jgi:hypothetical protein